jgi:cytochrome c1
MNRRILSAAAGAAMLFAYAGAFAAEGAAIPRHSWSWQGIFGTFERPALQRGLQVYKDVCAGCHGLRHVAYRNLAELGYSEDQVKAFAAEYEVPAEPDEEGEVKMRPAKPSDKFVSPFPNEQAARAANSGTFPPDLSLIVDARGKGLDFLQGAGGADYLYAILIGYGEAPEGVKLGEGMSYHKYFPGHQIAMPPPLADDAVEYGDGTKATVDQMARDVTAFLVWATEPNLEARKAMGLKVLLFLLVLTGMLIAVKKKVWADVH